MRIPAALFWVLLVLALVADLLLVPALVQVGWMRFTPRAAGARGQ